MILTRRFAPSDIPSVIKIVEESLGENYPPSLYLTIHNLWSEGFLVLTEHGKLVGFVAAVPSGSKVARVLMLAVLPRYRNKSYGKVLMKGFYENSMAKGMDSVVLEVRKSNSAAISFYEREGFSIYGEMKKFYSNGEDAYKMMKVLRS
jgi:ribosomal-protein-alanine N-acetyltransferase